MGDYIPPFTTCDICSGDGLVEDDVCLTCFGTGTLPVQGKTLLLSKRMLEKLDAIIAEQASQREDLTAALMQIWNKVKDL